jgi:hypothetical protein
MKKPQCADPRPQASNWLSDCTEHQERIGRHSERMETDWHLRLASDFLILDQRKSFAITDLVPDRVNNTVLAINTSNCDEANLDEIQEASGYLLDFLEWLHCLNLS